MPRDERTHPRIAPHQRLQPFSRGVRLANVLLSGPLTFGLVALGCLQLVTWLPHYLTWPYWADHDAFAAAARGWFDGRLPYRDTVGNNFPGTLYLFALIGLTAGWERPWLLFALDAALLLTVLGALLVWSRNQFGRALPGVIGGLHWLGYYLSLDYAHVAQRDWHAAAFAIGSLLIIQTRRGLTGRIGSALAAAVAMSIRPQAILFLPAIVWAVAASERQGQTIGKTIGSWKGGRGSRRVEKAQLTRQEPRRPESGSLFADNRRHATAAFQWLPIFVAALAAAFVPLIVTGVFGDFIRGVGLTTYGGSYNHVTPASFLKSWLLQAAAWQWWVVVGGILVLSYPFSSRPARVEIPWLIALLGASLYKPLSPVAHSYLDIPLIVVWSVNVACLIGLAFESTSLSAEGRLATVLLTLGLGSATLRPTFCQPGPCAGSVISLVRGSAPGTVPPGYRRGTVPTSAFYSWNDYRAALGYLRDRTGPQTQVANVLKGDPAIVSMVNRPSAFPAESIAWLRMVKPDDEPRFARALEAARDSVVVWAPDEAGPDPDFKLDLLTAVIQRHYRREVQFGVIEIWRRAPE